MSSALGGASPVLAGPQPDAPRPSRRGPGPLARATLSFASDERLAKRASVGDSDAFAAIFHRYGQDLYRFCVGILREPQDAQDAVQNTMIRAMRALPGETRDMQLRPWLYRIAHNESVELRRRERPAEQLGPTIDVGPGTEERVEQDARLETLLADIADLPERQRASLVMRELNGLGFGEIGAALGTSPGAVRQALYEARRGLSQMEQGRDMDCEAAMRQVSDEDGDPRRRGVRAHLRDCGRCRRFQTEIRERKQALAAISPMPLVPVAALVKSSLGGAAAGSAGSIGAAAGSAGGSAAAGSAGAAVSAAAGSVGASGLAKAAAGLLAALALGAGAADHGGLLRLVGHDPRHAGGSPADVLGVEAATAGRGVGRPTGDGLGPARHAAVGSKPGAGPDAQPKRTAPTPVASLGGDSPRDSVAHVGTGTTATSMSDLAPSDGSAENSVLTEMEGESAGDSKASEKSQGSRAESSEGKDSENGSGNGSEKANGKGSEKAEAQGAEESKAKGSENSQGKSSEKSETKGSENSQGKGAEKSEDGHPAHPEQSKKEVAAISAPEAATTAPTTTVESEAEPATEVEHGKGKPKKEAEAASG